MRVIHVLLVMLEVLLLLVMLEVLLVLVVLVLVLVMHVIFRVLVVSVVFGVLVTYRLSRYSYHPLISLCVRMKKKTESGTCHPLK